ncbi:MAG: TlpA family protein disulfide reductase [Acidobacteriota bacterium]|jgi:cytochrome c biogenesis protein CcmG/thiol:disulfide interchange protein DsbE
MRRNIVVLFVVLFTLAALGWAGWANWEYRKQAAERAAAIAAANSRMVPNISNGTLTYISPLNGKPAPNFSLEDLSGKEVSLASFRGKAVLINFWATWCTPCKLETPWLIELRKKYEQQGFEVIGISTEGDDIKPSDKAAWDKDKQAVEKFVREEGVPYPILMGGDSIAQPYGGVDDLPTSFYVDRKGVVVAAQMGITSESEMESNIRKALQE